MFEKAGLGFLLAFLLLPGVAAAQSDAGCVEGVYVVDGPPLLPGAVRESGDRIVVEDGRVSIRSGCRPTRAWIVQKEEGWVLRARWRHCGDLARRVRLRARLAPDCSFLAGRVAACAPPWKIEFKAARCEDCGGGCGDGRPCPEGQFCESPTGVCSIADGAGSCEQVSEFCPDIYRPVCGCDGRTYSNDCDRRAAAVSAAHRGRCDCELVCPHGSRWFDDDGDGCPDRCKGECQFDCDCYRRFDEKPVAPCADGCLACEPFWQCIDGLCVDQCGPMPPLRCSADGLTRSLADGVDAAETDMPRRCFGRRR